MVPDIRFDFFKNVWVKSVFKDCSQMFNMQCLLLKSCIDQEWERQPIRKVTQKLSLFWKHLVMEISSSGTGGLDWSTWNAKQEYQQVEPAFLAKVWL